MQPTMNDDLYGFFAHNNNGDPNGEFVYNSQPQFQQGVENRSGGRVGLKLTKTASFLSSLNELTNKPADPPKSPDKLKAANFSALSLQIASWKIVSMYEGDLVAKCYFKKKKLVWEILDGNMKKKIEFQWSDISAIRALFPLNSPAMLDIMLEKSPLFFQEVNPQPRKHTNWEQTHDFTNSQASLVRRHTLLFSQGVLEKQYEKILQADPKLHELSQQPFPDNASPLFREIRFANQPSYVDNHQFYPDFTATQHHQQQNPLGHLGFSGVGFPGQNSTSSYPVVLDPYFLDGNSQIPMGEPDAVNFQTVGYSMQDYTSVGSFASAADNVPHHLGFDQSGGWNYESVDEHRHGFYGGGDPWL